MLVWAIMAMPGRLCPVKRDNDDRRSFGNNVGLNSSRRLRRRSQWVCSIGVAAGQC
jgi:hypothetical protein